MRLGIFSLAGAADYQPRGSGLCKCSLTRQRLFRSDRLHWI